MLTKKNERGQAIVLIALAMVGLIGFTALSVDGGTAYINNRQAQNAADSAALSAALTIIRNPDLSEEGIRQAAENMAINMAANNGYDISDPAVTVTTNWPPDDTSAYAGNNEYVQVIIESQVETFFASVIGIDTTNSRVEAVARAKPPTTAIPFDGAAVVGLADLLEGGNGNNAECPIDVSNTKWEVTGGGLFSNGCVNQKNLAQLTIPDDKCVTSVGGSNGFDDIACVESYQSEMHYSQDDIDAIMPPRPACDDTPEGGYNITSANIDSFNDTYTNGIYCISNFDPFDSLHTHLENATLYVTDPEFEIKFNGNGASGGEFTGYASTSGPYKGFYLIVEGNATQLCESIDDKHHTQIITLRGNGNLSITGTILAPTACLDLRGNSGEDAMDSQIIGYKVGSNSNAAGVNISYNPDNNAKIPVPPQIELAE